MKRNVFKYLRKKILEYSTITEEVDEVFHSYRIECLGFEESVNLPVEIPSRELAQGMLIDELVCNADFMRKLEQIETRKDNLKSLLG